MKNVIGYAEMAPEIKKEVNEREYALLLLRNAYRKQENGIAAAKIMKADKSFMVYMKEDLKAKKAAYMAADKAYTKWMKANNVPCLGDRILVD